jgi:ribosomal protein S18 acetylase RimI-like enzyme
MTLTRENRTVRIESLGYRTDVMVRRMSGSIVEKRSEYVVVRTPAFPGFWWGNFLLMPAAPSLADAERWETWFVAEFPGAAHRAFGVDTTDGETGDAKALVALGASTRVNAVMSSAALREPDRPALEVRAFQDPDWAQLGSLRSTVYATPDDDPAGAGAESEFVAWQVAASEELVARGHGEWLGAFDDGLLVAALGIVSDGSGAARYQAVETHPGYRRRGLARRLVYDAAVLAADRLDARELVIVADPEDHARTLYEWLGFVTVEQQVEVMRAPPIT